MYQVLHKTKRGASNNSPPPPSLCVSVCLSVSLLSLPPPPPPPPLSLSLTFKILIMTDLETFWKQLNVASSCQVKILRNVI